MPTEPDAVLVSSVPAAAPASAALADAPASVTAKGAWSPTEAGPHHVLGPGAHLPVMTLLDTAIDANIAVMQDFCERNDLAFAPHMKTHMVPALAERQIAAGAWGVTVASVQQAMVAWEHGIHRILIANEVLDPAGLAWVASRNAADADADVLCYVDSAPGVEAAARAAASVGGAVHVLVEVGFLGGRTGVRTPEAALEVARAAHTAGLVVRGVSGYEGGLPSVDAARSYIAGVLAILQTMMAEGLVAAGLVAARLDDRLGDGDRAVLSMGGSAYFDAVADTLADRRDGIDVVLRSGSSLTHDDGTYAHKTPFTRIPGSLHAAIEIWGRVTSTPEPGLALVAVGKRDAPFDEGLPVVRRLLPGGTPSSTVVVPAADALVITRMDDQHAYVAVGDGVTVTPGDVVVLGISHPCTAFDKWRSVHLVDDDRNVVATLGTWF
jgi:D-serine deaminase-like pyridoxal phosphate-dependent protein